MMARGRGRARGRGHRSSTLVVNRSTPTDDEDLSEDLDESQETSNAEEDELESESVRVDRRKPQLKNNIHTLETKSQTPTAERKAGRPPKRGRGGAAQVKVAPTQSRSALNNSINNNNSSNSNNSNNSNNSEVNSDGENSESQGENSSEPSRKRGRKPKEPIKAEDRYVPTTDASKRGIMAEGGGGSLRRRDQIKSKARYSPPPFDTPKREKGSVMKFPSTTSSARYVTESDEEEVSVSPTFKISSDVSPPRRKSTTSRVSANDSSGVVHSFENVGVSRIADGSKLVVTLPDGSSIKVDASTPSSKKVAFKATKKVGAKQMESIEIDFDDVGAKDDPDDDDYKPSRVRKKTEEVKKEAEKTKIISTYSRATPKQAITTSKPLPVTPVSHIKSPMTGGVGVGVGVGSKITPKFVTTAQQNRQQTQRRTPTQMTKYIDALPELHECTHDIDTDVMMAKLPDKILLLHSELPLKLALSVEHDDEPYLFRQIISPMDTNRYVCLLCKGIDVSFATKEEKDILSHYRTLHELEVVTANAKFSEDIVFICLPKAILQQLTAAHHEIPLNAPCQYCGDDMRLLNIESMKDHYSSVHNKEVTMIEQEEILRMHQFFYCSQCKHQSTDFDSHHKHMKEDHKLKSYKCKSCVLITQDVTRLKTHFRAKHMINNANQNMQCYYCHGLLIGLDRLNKHIQQSHMVQTGPQEFSCVACLKPCGRGKDLLVHAQACTQAGSGSGSMTTSKTDRMDRNDREDKSKSLTSTAVKQEEESDDMEAICFLCGDEFESNRICDLHQHHVHMKWVSDLRRYTNSSDQIQLQIKELTIEDLTPEQDLRKSKVDTIVGHWCRMCDQMVKVYRLFYLHMANYHKLDKEFQCNISNCKSQFNSPETFQEHIIESGHTQKTIITHPDEVFVCTYCDLYFGSDEELVTHLITDQHINKFTASGHFHRTEPRNYKCKACHTFFGMKESYIHHLESEPHQYACPYCGISTATPSSRRAHIQNSHPDKLQICEECNEPQSDVLAHFVTHGFAFECKKCIKKFYNREQLNAHMEAHQDPIVCNWDNCGKTIATRSMLVTHYRNHKSEYKCTVCGQAFWNINMLNSHQRSHQSVQRIQSSNLSPTKPTVGRPSTKTPIIQSIANKNDSQQVIKFPSALSTTTTSIKSKPGIGISPQTIGSNLTKPQVSNTVIKCGHCSVLFKNAKDLAGHKCVKTTQMKHEILPEESKLLELAAKAAAAVKPQQTAKTPRGRRQSPKKQVHQQQQQQQQPVIDLNALTAAQGIANQAEDGTQVIMILNQESGELMEITAPQGMAVSEVISSLNFVRPQVSEVSGLSGSATSSSMTFGQQLQQSLGTSGSTGASLTHSTNAHSAPQEQTIMLPANCFNEDGSLTLDAATLSSLNLAIAVDGNGDLTTDGNTTFIIDTSNNK